MKKISRSSYLWANKLFNRKVVAFMLITAFMLADVKYNNKNHIFAQAIIC